MVSICFSSIILTDKTTTTNDFEIDYFFDNSKNLTIQDISTQNFTQKIKNRFAFGYIKGNNWFKFEIINRSKSEKFILKFNEVLFETVDLYEFKKNNWQKSANGFSVLIDQKDIKSKNPSFIIDIKKDEKKIFYIKSYSKLSNFGEFQIHNYDFLIKNSGVSITFLYMIYFGILLSVILLNLFLYFRFKESIYLYYVSYTFFYALSVSQCSGFILYLGFENWYYELDCVIPLFILFLILFSNEFLDIKKMTPTLYKLSKIAVVILFLLSLLIFIDIEPWYEVLNIFATLCFLLLIAMSILTMIRGNKKSKYYLFAIGMYMISILFISSMANGWFEYNYFNRYVFLLGSCFEILFFSLMLINRFYEGQNEKIKVNNELLKIQNENELYLREEVEKRTNEVKNLNTELYNIINDKELLLKELYHRVKNNFQMITGLLWIESNNYKDKTIKNSLNLMISRIKSMSVIHNYLYNANNLSQIDSNEYILSIITEVKKIYEVNNIKINNQLEVLELSIDNAMTLGIIINEVLNNAIKHHENKNECIVNIYFKNYDNKYLLTIQDNGKIFDGLEDSNGFGMGIIEQFSKKLKNSTYTFIPNSGNRFELFFEN